LFEVKVQSLMTSRFLQVELQIAREARIS